MYNVIFNRLDFNTLSRPFFYGFKLLNILFFTQPETAFSINQLEVMEMDYFLCH